MTDGESEELEKEVDRLSIEEKKLSIEEKKLTIEKLKRDLEKNIIDKKVIDESVKNISQNLKVVKRKSNFYSALETYKKVDKIGLIVMDSRRNIISNEIGIARENFNSFILSTNKLRSIQDDAAEIEIISPVLREGRYKWRGIYKGEPINFEMRDVLFRNSVIIDHLPFQSGSKILCVLNIDRELNEVGNVRDVGYSVSTVIKKIDGEVAIDTKQGKIYLQAKKYQESQGDLFEK